MADLLVTRQSTGVTIATTTDPFSTFAVHRIDRTRWRNTPDESGIYVLYGLIDGEAAAYIGMSTAGMRSRIASHHVSEKKAWFGTLFAMPLPAPLCPAVEAELIRSADEAGIVRLSNANAEARWLDGNDAHVGPALDTITDALEVLLGIDLFTARDEPEDDATTASGGARTPWTEERWMSVAEAASGKAYVDGVRALVATWVGSADNRTVAFGSGQKDSALFLVLRGPNTNYWPLALYATSIEVPIQWMRYRDASSSEPFLLELFDRFNSIDGIEMDEERRWKRPSFPASVVADAATREQVADVTLWFAGEVQERIDAGSG